MYFISIQKKLVIEHKHLSDTDMGRNQYGRNNFRVTVGQTGGRKAFYRKYHLITFPFNQA